MKKVTVEYDVFTYDELDDKAKEKALNNHIESLDYEWWDGIYEDFLQIADIIGIVTDRKKIHFSGFWAQGDGAQFEGTYYYEKGCKDKIRGYAPNDKELHRIVDNLVAIQKEYFYLLYAEVKSYGRYSHENATTINVELDSCASAGLWGKFFRDDHYNSVSDDIAECLRDLMRWLYAKLQNEYEWLTSEEYFKIECEELEYVFLENGKLFFE